MRPLALLLVIACDGGVQTRTRTSNDVVPVNSAAEARLGAEGGHRTKEHAPLASPTTTSSSSSDSTKPYIVKVGETPLNRDSPPKPEKSEKGDTKAGSGDPSDRMTKTECDTAFDKYARLQIAKNPALRGAPPEAREILKKEMAGKRKDADCSGTKAQFNCAMAASTTAGWQQCMKESKEPKESR